MQNIILGAGVFLFATALALNFYSYTLLKRSIEVMRFTLHLMDRYSRKEKQ